MEVVIIDAATFNRMLAGFGELAEKVERLCREHADMGDMQWLDSGDVCRLLDISPRTLQTMRENGTMPFSRICNKVYYKPEDVRRILPVVDVKRRIAAGAKEFESVTIKTNDIWKATTSGCCQQAAIRG